MYMKLRNRVCLVILTAVLLLVLTGCKPYYAEDFIGMTSQEIIEQYGEFDHTHNSPGADRLYRNTMCGYIVKDAAVGFLGTDPPEYFLIHFGSDGIAYKCTYEAGGWGG